MIPAMPRRIAITGGHGFLGWHAACRLRAVHGVEAVRLGREELDDDAALDAALATCDGVLHLAGVNRASSEAAVEQGNLAAAQQLAAGLRRQQRPIDVSYANSIQAELDNPYGRGKAVAAEVLRAVTENTGGSLADVLLPNLFGEHGRPGYNSFVATFAHEVARGKEPTITGDRRLPLLHAQAAAEVLISGLGTSGRLLPAAEERGVVEVLQLLKEFHDLYAVRGEIPPLTDDFRIDLFNTYRAAAFPDMWPLSPQVHRDDRGNLFEAVRAHGGTGQAFVSTTRPGRMRGDHYHLRKVERFFVVRGQAEISLRPLLHDDSAILRFGVDGDQPSFIDMPTLWVHNIRNVGEEDLVTLFWADQLLDPDHPDQYAEKVEVAS